MMHVSWFPNAKYGHLVPREDSFGACDGTYVLADGTTRDPLDVRDFSGLSTEQFFASYPATSGSKTAADLFCREFLRVAGATTDPEPVREGFVQGNAAIAALNAEHNPQVDYLVNDFWSCVAVGITLRDGLLSWGCMNDCGLAIVSQDGQLEFLTQNGMAIFKEHEKKHLKIVGDEWNHPEYRRLIRSAYRNRPDQLFEGHLVSYGSLTGEPAAASFLRIGQRRLAPGDVIVLFTDGFEPCLADARCQAVLAQEPSAAWPSAINRLSTSLEREDPAKFGEERTIMIIESTL